jgi:hypothetical protein
MVDLAVPAAAVAGEVVRPKVELPKRSPAIPAVEAAKKVRRSNDREGDPCAMERTIAIQARGGKANAIADGNKHQMMSQIQTTLPPRRSP